MFLRDAIIFIGFVIGAIINVVGPGNFIRLDRNVERLSFVGIIKYTVAFGFDVYKWLFHDTNFIVIFLLLIIVGLFLYGHQNTNMNIAAYSFVSILALLSPWAVIFPVVLGYGKGFIANRCQIMIDIALYIAVCNIALVIGWWIMRLLDNQYRNLLSVVIMIVAFSSMCLSSYSIKQMGTVITYSNIGNGNYRGYYDQCKDFYNELSAHAGEDVVINTSDVPAPINDFSCMYLENVYFP